MPDNLLSKTVSYGTVEGKIRKKKTTQDVN